jgi:hypothetical protein
VARWSILLLVGATVSCGDSGVIGPAPPVTGDSVSFVHVDFVELNAYLNMMQVEMITAETMMDEFATVSQDWLNGRVNTYWSVEFTRNLLKRQEQLVQRSVGVRPTDPGLVEAHLLYEDALRLFGRAYGVFSNQVEFPDQSVFDGINADLIEGTLQLVRFQLAVSELAGRRIRFILL